jgi:cytochrome c553
MPSKRIEFLYFFTACMSVIPTARADVRFNRDVRPILAENCLSCHGPDEKNREADLRLDLSAEARKKSIVAGNPEKSRLFKRVISTDPDTVMPPPDSKKKLTAKQVETLRQWIAEGAKFEDHWAFEPILDPAVPGDASDGTEIDRFVAAAQKKAGLKMSAPVSREQLIRRATIDLIGLPPNWQEVQAFVGDKSPDAYEKVINRLLDSPRYGERWGRHWLDLARYADTHGGSAIGFQKFPFSYTYRDYVINAFNADLPYDRFVTEQLAADQLGLGPNASELAGLGFLTVGMQFRNKNDVIDDQIDVTTRGLLGLTVACARCHDHKYDPVPTADYYALYATFGSSVKPEELPIVGREPQSKEYRDYAKDLAGRRVLADDMARDQTEVMKSRLRMQVAIYLTELAKGLPEQDLSSAFLSYRTDDIRPLVLNRWRDYLAKLPQDDPVFGPWFGLFQLDRTEKAKFAEKAPAIVARFKSENGDPAKFSDQKSTGSTTPKWNPRVLEALGKKPPASLPEVAEIYGRLFAEVNREWLAAVMDATLEAEPGAKIALDEEERHRAINSAVNQQLRRHLFEPGTPIVMNQETAITLLNRTVHDSLRGKQGAVEALHLGSAASPPRAMVLEEKPRQEPFRVFRRGNPVDRGEIIEPHFLSV